MLIKSLLLCLMATVMKRSSMEFTYVRLYLTETNIHIHKFKNIPFEMN